VTATGITTTGATITWTTTRIHRRRSTTAQPRLRFDDFSGRVGDVSLRDSDRPDGGTTYDYDVTSVNGTTGSATSGNFSFVTTAVAPVISAVVVSGSTTTTATINWTTDQAVQLAGLLRHHDGLRLFVPAEQHVDDDPLGDDHRPVADDDV